MEYLINWNFWFAIRADELHWRDININFASGFAYN